MSDVKAPSNFIRQIIDRDLAEGKNDGRVVTRFPPEPNGYLHIGHAKSICLNFGIAESYGGACHLRFDDTNPEKEEEEYIVSIQRDVEWLGFQWAGPVRFASGYFDQLYQYALQLIDKGLAYVDTQSPEQIAEMRGNYNRPGQNSPHRERSVEENRALFERMKEGGFEEGEAVLRAKIDMASANINLRDPILYRVRKKAHHQTGDKWVIYPMYDFTHPLSDAIEGVTHSLCTLEFEDHRPLYDWILENVSAPCRPRQIEFSRLSLDYTVMSKRLLTTLVDANHVSGWDDPRMPTLSGMRRRGYTPRSIRTFCNRVGITKKDQQIELSALENCIREDLERIAPRRLGVLRPLKIVVENYPEDQTEEFTVPNHPGDSTMGTRTLAFCREIWIDENDFIEDPPAKFFRLAPGREVRLRYAYYITCTRVIKDNSGRVTELRCSHDPDSRGGGTADGRKVKGTLHWVSARHALDAEIRLYNPLFSVADPKAETDRDFHDFLNDESLITLSKTKVEATMEQHSTGECFQLERLGYFCVDPDSTTDRLVLNRTVALRDSRPRTDTS